jgi:phospholipid/cholesterol/gamma-HCH transport system substrate-binding protein
MNREKGKEFIAGIFLIIGLVLIAGLIILFGEVPDMFKPVYRITVKFSDASGLLKGSDVFLAGAVIGKVTSDPVYIPDTQEVEVHLKINKDVLIRNDASYEIGDSGLLGDRFVVVVPKKLQKDEKDDSPYIQDGDQIEGTQEAGLKDIMQSSKPLIDKANDIAAQLDEMITRLNVDVLPSTSTQDLKETIQKLRHMVDNGDLMIANANDLLDQAKHGQGVLGRLINDKKVADNLATFIANLKAHGPIFYHDDSGDQSSTKSSSTSSPTPRKDDGSHR